MYNTLKFNKMNNQYYKLFVCIHGSHCSGSTTLTVTYTYTAMYVNYEIFSIYISAMVL